MQPATAPVNSTPALHLCDACKKISKLPGNLGSFAGKAIAIVPTALFVGTAKALLNCRLSSFKPKPIANYLATPAKIGKLLGTGVGYLCQLTSSVAGWCGRFVGYYSGLVIGFLAGKAIITGAKFINSTFKTNLQTRSITAYSFIGGLLLGNLGDIASRVAVASLNPTVLAPIILTGFSLEVVNILVEPAPLIELMILIQSGILD